MEQQLRILIIKALNLLSKEYTQQALIYKLGALGFDIKPSSISKIKSGNQVGHRTLVHCAKYMAEIIERELDMEFDHNISDFTRRNTPGWQRIIIPEHNQAVAKPASTLIHAGGRFSVEEKSRFIGSARQDLIEVGVRLNSYTTYFVSHSDSAFKTHIIDLLQNGVRMKSYLLDPDSQEARIYFNDRTKVQNFEKDALEESKRNIDRLKALCQEFKQMGLKGAFEIFLYRHIPFSQILVVDSQAEWAKMMVSAYLYGVKRANCPVLEFTKKEQSMLFKMYWESLQLFTSDAIKLE